MSCRVLGVVRKQQCICCVSWLQVTLKLKSAKMESRVYRFLHVNSLSCETAFQQAGLWTWNVISDFKSPSTTHYFSQCLGLTLCGNMMGHPENHIPNILPPQEKTFLSTVLQENDNENMGMVQNGSSWALFLYLAQLLHFLILIWACGQPCGL